MLKHIVAVGSNNGLGYKGNLLWSIPEDLARFKKLTMGKVVIMGRKTYESLPGQLKGRKMIVVTRDENYKAKSSEVEIRNDLAEVLAEYELVYEDVYIIGGGEIYKKSLGSVMTIEMTCIHEKKEADTYYPEDLSEFMCEYSSEMYTCAKTGVRYNYIKLVRDIWGRKEERNKCKE